MLSEASFYPPNMFADHPMDSKQRIQDALIDVIKRKVTEGVFNPPSKGAALQGFDLWGS